EHVDCRRDPGAERGHRLVEDLSSELVPSLQRMCPDRAGQTGTSALLHQMEQVTVPALLDPLASPGLHRRAARVGLHASVAPTRATGAVDLHHDVADLAGATATYPRLAVENQTPADAGSPEDAEQRV